jgi:hypothetical protein
MLLGNLMKNSDFEYRKQKASISLNMGIRERGGWSWVRIMSTGGWWYY